MTRRSLLVLVLGVGIGGALGASVPGCATTSSAGASAGLAPPPTPDECRACNGAWGMHGIAQVESCNCRTTDGGKRCRDGVDCQGMCIAAEDPEREIVQAGSTPRGFFIGRCSDLVTVFGCSRVIDRGAAAHGPVPMGEPPESICVD